MECMDLQEAQRREQEARIEVTLQTQGIPELPGPQVTFTGQFDDGTWTCRVEIENRFQDFVAPTLPDLIERVVEWDGNCEGTFVD